MRYWYRTPAGTCVQDAVGSYRRRDDCRRCRLIGIGKRKRIRKSYPGWTGMEATWKWNQGLQRQACRQNFRLFDSNNKAKRTRRLSTKDTRQAMRAVKVHHRSCRSPPNHTAVFITGSAAPGQCFRPSFRKRRWRGCIRRVSAAARHIGRRASR